MSIPVAVSLSKAHHCKSCTPSFTFIVIWPGTCCHANRVRKRFKALMVGLTSAHIFAFANRQHMVEKAGIRDFRQNFHITFSKLFIHFFFVSYLYFCLSIHLRTYPFIYVSVHPTNSLAVALYLCLTIHWSSIYLSIILSVHFFIY